MNKVLAVDEYEFNLTTHEFKKQGVSQKIEPIVFKLLVFFIHNSERIICYDELLKEVWRARLVSNSTINATVSAARKKIGDSGKEQKYISTISGAGYRFTGKIKTTCQNSNRSIATENFLSSPLYRHPANSLLSMINTELDNSDIVIPEKPSLAVMNCKDVGRSAQSDQFAAAISIDINAALSRLPNIFVIARASAAIASNLALTPLETCQLLKVRYLVYLSSHRIDRKFKINLSIVEGKSNAEIWSEHYTSSIDDLFLAEQQVTERIVSSVDTIIERSEISRVLNIKSEDLNSWDLYHRGLSYINQTQRANLNRAQVYFNRALKLDATFSRAFAGLAYVHTNLGLLNEDLQSQSDFARATDYAYQSIDHWETDPAGHFALSRILLFTKQYFSAGEIVDRIIEHNPSYARVYFSKSMICAFNSRDREIYSQIANAQSLSPLDPLQFSLKLSYAVSLINQGDYREAALWSLSAARDPNAWVMIYAMAAASLHIAGEHDQARILVLKTLNQQANFCVGHFQRLFAHANRATNKKITDAMHAVGFSK